MTKIIAEISSCHNGDLELAKALIRAAAENGADIVKFQDWRASNIPDDDTDKERYKKYEFKDEWYPFLINYCKEQGVEFLTTCFNKDRVVFLSSLGLKRIKIASISMTNVELIMEAALNFDELIVSTGMHSKEEIQETIDLLLSNAKDFTIMHCIANYPLSIEDANLEEINKLKRMLGEYGNVGYSDHSLDLDVAKCAAVMGVKYIEKHFTLSRYLPQIPHQMYKEAPPITTHSISIEPNELNELSVWIEKIDRIIGIGNFDINELEKKIKEKYLNRYGI